MFLHVDWTEDGDPRFAEQTCFGDPCLTQLCPANPDVRAYALALAQDLAGRGIASVLAESLHHHPLEHGAHHERYFVELGAVARLLLGLCFCPHCLDGARRPAPTPKSCAHGPAPRSSARSREPRRRRRRSSRTSEAAALLGGQLGALLQSRCEVVATLAGELAEATRARGARLELLDGSGAVKGYATGRPEGGPAPSIAWRLGVDIAACARAGAADRGDRLRGRPGPRGARPRVVPSAGAGCAPGRRAAAGTARLRFLREPGGQAARGARGGCSTASTSTTTAWRR